MQPHDLLNTADFLLWSASRPTKSNLCRSISSTYYALFHCLASECADQFIGRTKKGRPERAWVQVYRAVEHGFVKDKCKKPNMLQHFPPGVVDFANEFVRMQEQRHKADYDPSFTTTKSQAFSDLISSSDAIKKFLACDKKHRKAFCAYILLRDPRK